MNRHYLNSDDFDERGVLKDGHHLKVHMQAMDSGHRAMLDGKPARIMDGTGDPLETASSWLPGLGLQRRHRQRRQGRG